MDIKIIKREQWIKIEITYPVMNVIVNFKRTMKNNVDQLDVTIKYISIDIMSKTWVYMNQFIVKIVIN